MKYEEYGCFDIDEQQKIDNEVYENCLLYTSPSPRD